MRQRRRSGHWLGALCVAAALGALVSGGAQGQSAADWQATALPGAAVRVFAVGDGALLVETADDELFRSDDRGTTFRPIALPPRSSTGTPRVLAVDPTSSDLLYVTGDAGLYKSSDGGASYALVLPEPVAAVSISAADPQLLYVGAPGPGSNRFRFLRSNDAGGSFVLLEEQESQNPNCVFGLSVLWADPLDPRRVFRSASCVAGRDLASPTFSRPLERSVDQGATFAVVARPPGAFADQLVGGAGSQPSRYYLSDVKPFFAGPSALFRSDDGGSIFSPVFQFPRGADVGPTGSQTVIGGLAVAPASPDRVFLGRRNGATGVLTSADGGVTFVALGRQDIGEVLDLVLSVDGLDLYAGTTDGLFRLSLREGIPSPPPLPAPTRPAGTK
jgi:hypothetical protein